MIVVLFEVFCSMSWWIELHPFPVLYLKISDLNITEYSIVLNPSHPHCLMQIREWIQGVVQFVPESLAYCTWRETERKCPGQICNSPRSLDTTEYWRYSVFVCDQENDCTICMQCLNLTQYSSWSSCSYGSSPFSPSPSPSGAVKPS